MLALVEMAGEFHMVDQPYILVIDIIESGLDADAARAVPSV